MMFVSVTLRNCDFYTTFFVDKKKVSKFGAPYIVDTK